MSVPQSQSLCILWFQLLVTALTYIVEVHLTEVWTIPLSSQYGQYTRVFSSSTMQLGCDVQPCEVEPKEAGQATSPSLRANYQSTLSSPVHQCLCSAPRVEYLFSSVRYSTTPTNTLGFHLCHLLAPRPNPKVIRRPLLYGMEYVASGAILNE